MQLIVQYLYIYTLFYLLAMNLKLNLFFCVLFAHFFSYSQITNLSTIFIPDSLKTGANAVVRQSKKEIEIVNEKNMIITYTKVITVLNEDGNRHVDVYMDYSNDSKIKKISAVMYNKMGMEILKYKKKDFHDVSAADGFYSDSRVKFLDFTPRGYPYTLKFEYVFVSKTTAFIPKWFPLNSYGLSVESKEIIVQNANNLKINLKEKLFDKFPIQNLSQGNTIHYKIENQKAIKKETFSPSFENVFPSLKIYLEKFTLKGYVSDEIKNWKDFGFWLRKNLYESQLTLTDETKKKIRNLVKDQTDPVKKAQIVYEYMQNRTRYVYVGIGVGGWQPTSALDVDRLGYGDCKGLSNYTKALLDAVGIESNWVIVYASQKRSFDKEFHGIQGNHMILNLPKLNNGQDVWLECTSQTIPFGFLGDFTDDRDVLIIEKDGGVIKHTPKYPDKNNQQITTGTIKVDHLGNVNANIQMKFTGLQYDNQYGKETKTSKELQEYYQSRRWDYIDNLRVLNHEFTNTREELSFVEDLKINADNYATVLGNEMILRLNVFNKNNISVPENKNRKNDVYVKNGYLDTDELEIEIPTGYSFNQENNSKTIDTKFGRYSISIHKENKKLIYKRQFLLKEGVYGREEYKDFSNFIDQVNNNDNLKIAFNKN